MTPCRGLSLGKAIPRRAGDALQLDLEIGGNFVPRNRECSLQKKGGFPLAADTVEKVGD
jgi:hypothetical protein